MDNLHEFFNKGIDANSNGYKLGAIRGGAMGIIWGIVVCIFFPYANFANDFYGQREHSMLIVSNIILLLTGVLGSPFNSAKLTNTQVNYGVSAIYNHGYNNAYVKFLFLSISFVMVVTSILSLYNVFRDKIGIWVAIVSYILSILISIYIYAKTPSKEF